MHTRPSPFQAALGLAALALTLWLGACGRESEPPPSEFGEDRAVPAAPGKLRLAVFDCGSLQFESVEAFGVTLDEVSNVIFVPCYLVEHPKGRLLWDAGLPPSLAEQPDGQTLEGGVVLKLARTLPDQLAELGLTPADIDNVAFSHMHFDHVGHANLFPHAKLWIQRAEHEAAFAKPKPTVPYFDPALYGALEGAETVLLDGDRDVFGDGRVSIVSAPGHTPGHQVLLLDLEEYGPLLLSGDLWHFQVSRVQQRVPQFNVDAEQTLESMQKVEELVDDVGATVWIEHDAELADTLELAPAWYD